MTSKSSMVRLVVAASIVMLALFAPLPVSAQSAAGAREAARAETQPSIPVRVDVLFTRFQGEKKLSSMPFSLLATAIDDRAGVRPVSIRMGIDVPIGSTTSTDNVTTPSSSGGATSTKGTTTTKVQYRSVGTDIDCMVGRLDETRFSVRVSVSDSSIYSADGDYGKALKTVDPAAFRTFSTNNTVVLKDGQTVLFATGTDKISGETLKIEVTLHVEK